MNRCGFMILELLIVVSLCALIAMLSMMQLSFLDSTIAHAEVDKLAGACSYFRQKAIATNSEYVLTCDVQNNEYRCDNMREKLSQRLCFGFLPNVLGPSKYAIHRINKAVTFVGSAIHFYPTGIISSGSVYLTDKCKKIMYALSNAVSQVSYLRLYRYDGKWELLNPV
jgi:hypothetical protein